MTESSVGRLARAAGSGDDPIRRRARRAAGRLVWFLGHLIVWSLGILVLLVTAGWYPALVVALAWGIGLASHGFFAVVAPGLLRRRTDAEVVRQLQGSAAAARRQLEGRHARSLEELSASVAHEIRNPITAAKSLVQQMGEDPMSPDHAEYARTALEELDRVERSVSHLLRYARDEELKLEDVDLASVLDAALRALEERRARSQARIERDVDVTARLRGDPEQLRRVLMNLVGNALDALDDAATSDPWVRISLGRSLAGTEVWVRVRDNGPGIAPALLDKIWSPFQTSKKNGTGLGLAITRKLVEAHGGTIEVTSAPAQGCEFVATFPSVPT